MGEDRNPYLLGNLPFEDMTDAEIEVCLIQIDIGGRFDGDIEFLNLVRDGVFEPKRPEQMEEDAKRMRELLRHSGVPVGFRLGDD